MEWVIPMLAGAVAVALGDDEVSAALTSHGHALRQRNTAQCASESDDDLRPSAVVDGQTDVWRPSQLGDGSSSLRVASSSWKALETARCIVR